MTMQFRIFSVGLVIGGTSFAQARQTCGTVVTAEQIAQELEWQDAGLFDGVGPRGVDDFRYVRVAIHVVRYSDGSGEVSRTDIQIGLHQANAEFASSRIVFIPIHVDYIDSDQYADLQNAEGESLRQLNVVAGALNVYYVPVAPYCGEATLPGGTPQGVIMMNSCAASGGVLSHEFGHYFSLYHTHETAFGADCPVGANCSADGDLVCDTPPDPGLSHCDGSLGSCVDNCTYTGDFICGPGDGVPFAPNVLNTMSYTDTECMSGFSAGQHVRIRAAIGLADRSDEVALENPCGVPTYARPGIGFGFGDWLVPAGGLRAGIALSANFCGNPEGGVVIALRGEYSEGTGVFNTPVTIVASREGTGDVVIRP
ncbi:MAG: M43 family zinc metalloprotease [Phycisphaerae bacterium]